MELSHTKENRKFVHLYKGECIAFYEAADDILCGRPHKHTYVSLMSFSQDLREGCTECGSRIKRQRSTDTIYIEMAVLEEEGEDEEEKWRVEEEMM